MLSASRFSLPRGVCIMKERVRKLDIVYHGRKYSEEAGLLSRWKATPLTVRKRTRPPCPTPDIKKRKKKKKWLMRVAGSFHGLPCINFHAPPIPAVLLTVASSTHVPPKTFSGLALFPSPSVWILFYVDILRRRPKMAIALTEGKLY